MEQRSNLTAWLRMLRWPNLIIIFLTQSAAWITLVLFRTAGVTHRLSGNDFFLVTASTMLIAAAGYVINDYFDVLTDRVNRPEKVILAGSVHRRVALLLYGALNTAALVCAYIAAIDVGRVFLAFIQAGTIVLLWVYSAWAKRRFLWGNLLVSLLSGLTIALVWLYASGPGEHQDEPAFRMEAYGLRVPNPLHVIIAFSLFAFFITWMRELVKDMEDVPGDTADGCDTMPIRWGVVKTGRFAQVIGVLVALMLITSAITVALNYYFLPALLLLLLMIRVGRLLPRLSRPGDAAHYGAISFNLKGTMVRGIFTLVSLWLWAIACALIIGFLNGGPNFG